jgi:hypothetical protein
VVQRKTLLVRTDAPGLYPQWSDRLIKKISSVTNIFGFQETTVIECFESDSPLSPQGLCSAFGGCAVTDGALQLGETITCIDGSTGTVTATENILFQSAPPVREPASPLLLGTGLLGATALRRKLFARRSSSGEPPTKTQVVRQTQHSKPLSRCDQGLYVFPPLHLESTRS